MGTLFDLPSKRLLKAYDPSQPRDEQGRWTGGHGYEERGETVRVKSPRSYRSFVRDAGWGTPSQFEAETGASFGTGSVSDIKGKWFTVIRDNLWIRSKGRVVHLQGGTLAGLYDNKGKHWDV